MDQVVKRGAVVRSSAARAPLRMVAAVASAVLMVLPTLLMLWNTGAHGQGLPDPTRPAIGYGASAGAGRDAAAAPAQLQVVLIGSGAHGRRVAVISGQTLHIGDKFDGAVLIGISENEVRLRVGNKVSVLKLFPVPDRPSGGSDGNATQ
jgi:MSHA biogenesis protein MshK